MREILRKIKSCTVDKPYVFISYSSEDCECVWNDVYEFQRRGYNIWLDEKNLDKTKQSWKEDALYAIEDIDCRLVLFYASEQSLCSENCYNEINQTISESTIESHFGPVKFVVIETSRIDDITEKSQLIFEQIRNSHLPKEIKMKKTQILHRFMDRFFNGNNERVRVHAKTSEYSIDYYDEIVSFFPKETRIASEKRNEDGPVQDSSPKGPKNEFKVFISYKHTMDDVETADYRIANRLYDELTARGIDAFFSFKSISQYGADKYKEIIDKALDSSSVLVVVGTSLVNINSSWVKYEWDSFYTDILCGRKNGKVFSYIDNVSIDSLPRSLRNSQSYEMRKVSVAKMAEYLLNAIRNLESNYSKPSYTIQTEFDNAKTNPIMMEMSSVDMLLKFANMVSCGDSKGEYVNPYVSEEMADIIADHVGTVTPYNAEKCMEFGINPMIYEVFLAQKIARINKPENCINSYQLLHQVVNSWTVFLNEDFKVVAYWIFIALKEKSYQLIGSGKVDEKDISIEDVRFIDMPGNYKGYLLLSGTIEQCRIPRVVNTLYDSWITYIEKLAEVGIFFDEIASMVGSTAGNSSLQNIGMNYYARYVAGGRMYKYDLRNIEKIVFLVKNYPNLCRMYKEEYDEKF